ncbi:MAG TPA: carboxypeptidase regulatory-like domain-containing protein [Pyrinomonadaceae bacterium]|nr:carboxypeptidase regulatory-like domain-containing protein [Pyrinomonadaceae bacterium]
MRKLRLLFFAFLLVPLIDAAAQDPFGSIEGTVKDPQGAVVQGATVTVRNIATNASRTVVTNDSGQYRILQLQPGNYEVKVAATNFKQSILESIQVQVGQIAAADVSLELGGAAESVTVTPDTEVQIERSDNTVSGVVSTRQIENLPLNGRNFLDLAQLQPGTERVDGGSFDPTKANFTGISVGGQAGRSTQISVDGGSVVDNVVGTTVQNFSQEIIQEFQIGLANFGLSTGASASGSVNVVSRSGSNDFHGNAFIFARDDSFAAFPALNRLDAFNGIPVEARAESIPFDRQQFGGTLGGRIIKDKLFFFGSYERNNQDGSSIYNPLRAPSFAGFSPNPFDETLFTTKVDWVINQRASSYFRYSFNDNEAVGPYPPGSGILPRESTNGIFTSNDQLVTNRSHNFVGGLTYLFGANISNSFVGNYSHFDNAIHATTLGVPEIRINPEQDWRSGTNAVTPQDTPQRRFQLKDDLTWIKGKHTLNFGGNYEWTSIGGTFTFANPVRFRLFSIDEEGNPVPFNTEADFMNAFVQDISMGVGSPQLPFNHEGDTINHRFSFYAGDSWKVRPNLTLNFGLGYRIDTNLWNHDLQRPEVIAPLFEDGTKAPGRDWNNFSPRVGFAWDPGRDGKTIIRGGFGMYYDNIIDNLRLFERADLGPVGAEQFLVGTQIVSPLLLPFNADSNGRFDPGDMTLAQAMALWPALRADLESRLTDCDLPTGLECTGSVSGPIFSSNFQVPYSFQYSIGVQRELPWNMVLQVDYNYRKGRNESNLFDVNQADSIAGPRLGEAFPFPIPYVDSSAFSTYSGILTRLDRRFSNGFQFTASYAWSAFKAFSADSLGLGGVPTDLNNLRADFGLAGLDRKHRFVVSGIYELPWFKNDSSFVKRNLLGNWTVSFISTAFSGLPESVFLPNSADLSASGTFLTYLPGTGPGSVGREIRSVSHLNTLISNYNNSIGGLPNTAPCSFDAALRCDLYDQEIFRIGLLPEDTQIGGDSLISQDLRVTKTINFSEKYRLQLTGEVFNLFNIANLVNVNDLVLPIEGTPANEVTSLRPTQRATSVFGTGGPRAFQFGAKFVF